MKATKNGDNILRQIKKKEGIYCRKKKKFNESEYKNCLLIINNWI